MITTPRTIMRPMEKADASAFHQWRSDPEVMRFTLGPDPDLATTMARVELAMEVDAKFGFSRWMVLDRSTGEPIGDAGLLPMPDTSDFELGYRLRRDQWGKGLATEIAQAWTRQARDQIRLPHLVGFTHPAHIVSQHILQKLGFRQTGEGTVYGMTCNLYRLTFAADSLNL